MGDLNSYAHEDPITAIKAGADDIAGTADDYTNLIAQYQGPTPTRTSFDGQAGYLDHALANPSLTGQVTGVADWHINCRTSPTCSTTTPASSPPAQDALYEPNAYRTSDHDAVVVGLNPLHYASSGFRRPLNTDGSSVFKKGSTIPVKIQFQAPDGSYPWTSLRRSRCTRRAGRCWLPA